MQKILTMAVLAVLALFGSFLATAHGNPSSPRGMAFDVLGPTAAGDRSSQRNPFSVR
jgi:hypothetical protein